MLLTLKATGDEFVFLILRICATSTVKGPDRSVRQMRIPERRRCYATKHTAEAELLGLDFDGHDGQFSVGLGKDRSVLRVFGGFTKGVVGEISSSLIDVVRVWFGRGQKSRMRSGKRRGKSWGLSTRGKGFLSDERAGGCFLACWRAQLAVDSFFTGY